MAENESAVRFAVEAVLDRIGPVLREVRGVADGGGEECLHRMRVATRRLRTALRFLAPSAGVADPAPLTKQIRALTRALGEARDLDVQILWLDEFMAGVRGPEKAGVGRVALRARQRRGDIQPRIARVVLEAESSPVIKNALRDLRREKLRMEMTGEGSGMGFEIPTRTIGLLLDSVVRGGDALAAPGPASGQHLLRIAIKRLRYAMELFAPLYAGAMDEYIAVAKSAQRLLGDLHDADVWIETMPAFAERELARTVRYYGNARPYARLRRGFEAIVRDRSEFRAAQYEKARGFWENAGSEGRWQSLQELLIGTYRASGGAREDF